MELTTANTNPSFPKLVGKTFVLSLAQSAGIWGGIIVAGLALDAFKNRKQDSTQQETPEDQ